MTEDKEQKSYEIPPTTQEYNQAMEYLLYAGSIEGKKAAAIVKRYLEATDLTLAHVEEQVSKVYMHITKGKFSKCSHYASVIITAADEAYEEDYEDSLEDIKKEYFEAGRKFESFGNRDFEYPCLDDYEQSKKVR